MKNKIFTIGILVAFGLMSELKAPGPLNPNEAAALARLIGTHR